MAQDGDGNRSIVAEIEELKGKLALLDGDRKAYYESALWTIKKNDEKLINLRKETRDLRKQYADRLSADDHVINKALAERPVERAVCMNKTGPQAVQLLDYKVSDTIKKLNALRHVSDVKEKRLSELETQYDGLMKEWNQAVAMDLGSSDEAQHLRALENRLDKAELKCKEADNIKTTYEQIKSKLHEEHMQFENVLHDLEAEIRKAKGELKDLKHMNTDAQLSRDLAQRELRKQEEHIYSERKKREAELSKLRKEAEERRQNQERMERRIAQRSALGDESTNAGNQSAMAGSAGSGLNEEQQEKISTYEEAFQTIKDATGVADIKEVVHRFENQGETQRHLEELKADAEKQNERLQEEKEKLQKEFEQLKYSGEAKMSSGQRLVEDFEKHVKEEQARLDANRMHLDKLSKLQITVRTGVEHLNEQLVHVKVAETHAARANVSPKSDEYALELLSRCEERVLALMQLLESTNMQEKMKQMHEEEFHTNLESNLPQYNTRVALPSKQKDATYEEDVDTDEEDEDVLSRNALKKQAQQLIDVKTKRKVAKKKKKTK